MVEATIEKPVLIDSSLVNIDRIVKSYNLFTGIPAEVNLIETCQYCNKHKPGCCLKNPVEPIATSDDYYCREPGKYKKL
jgi:hypothetical protein